MSAKAFVCAAILILVMTLNIICLLSGRWTKGPNNGDGTWTEFSPWGRCYCTDTQDCSQVDRLYKAAKAFSIAACIFEGVVVLLLLNDPFNTKGGAVIQGVLALLISACLIITWASIGATQDKEYCNMKLKTMFNLNWAFAIRVVEFCVWVGLTVVLFLQSAGKIRRTRTTLFIAALFFFLCLATTTSRGWTENDLLTQGTDGVIEGGLWEKCNCTSVVDASLGCQRRRHLMRSTAAFSIIGLGFSALLLVLVTGWVPAATGAQIIGVAVLAWMAQNISWISWAAFFTQDLCQIKFKTMSDQKLHWGWSLQICLAFVMIPVLILSILIARSN